MKVAGRFPISELNQPIRSLGVPPSSAGEGEGGGGDGGEEGFILSLKLAGKLHTCTRGNKTNLPGFVAEETAPLPSLGETSGSLTGACAPSASVAISRYLFFPFLCKIPRGRQLFRGRLPALYRGDFQSRPLTKNNTLRMRKPSFSTRY